VFFLFLPLFLAGKLKSRCSSFGGVAVIMSLTVVVWPFFQFSSSIFGARST
jgi:hypothetical protein